MRLLIIGQCVGYNASGFACCHVDESRDLAVARWFSKFSYDVSIISTISGPRTDMPVQRVGWGEVTPSQFDVVMLCNISGWWNAKGAGWEQQLRGHPCVVSMMDSCFADTHELGFLRGTTLPSAQCVRNFREILPGNTSWFAPYGCPDVAESYPDPWKGNHPKHRAIFCGCVYQRRLEMLNKLAEDERFDLWVVGLFMPQGTQYTGLTAEQRKQLLHPRVHLVTDMTLEKPDPAAPVNGPLPFGTAWPFVMHSDVGINLSPARITDAVSAKIYDYLACGIPVVTEDGVSNVGDIYSMRAGCQVPFGDAGAIGNAVVNWAETSLDKATLMREAAVLNSWETMVRILDSHIRQRHGH